MGNRKLIRGVIIMSRNIHKEMWSKLKTVIIFGGKKRYTRKEMVDLMSNIELSSLAGDMSDIVKSIHEPTSEAKK